MSSVLSAFYSSKMNRRECFRKTINHEQPEKVLVDMGKQVGSLHKFEYAKLKEHLGSPEWMQNDNNILDKMGQTVHPDEELLQHFDIDFRWVIPHWVGVKGSDKSGQKGYYDMWGSRFDYMDDYYAFMEAPLKNATSLEDIENYDWPDPNNPAMFEGLREQAKYWYEHTDYVIGADGIKGGILQSCLWIRGYEQFFMDLAGNKEFAEALLDKVLELFKQMYTNYFNEVGEYVQLVYITDDVGTQNSLLVSPRMFRKTIKPKFEVFIDYLKRLAPHVKVMYHTDGSVLPLIGDFVEMGADILNPIQTSTKGLDDTKALKEQFGEQIAFHGAIDVQKVLPNATPEAVKQEVARRIRDLGPNGGYICAPCHNLSYDIPPENVAALFEAAKKFGQYPLT